MVRLISTLALVIFSSLVLGAEKPSATRSLMILEAAPTMMRAIPNAQVVSQDGDSAIIRVSDKDVESFSKWVHDNLGGCGGFLDVTEEVNEGRTLKELLQTKPKQRSTITPPTSPSKNVSQLVAKVDKEKLWNFLAELSAFPDRSASTENGVKAANFLKDRGSKTGANLPGLSAELIETGTSYKQPSVLITYPGKDPSLPGVVIGGHLDTYSDNKPGADDDGSGSSIVMEALRTISASDARFQRTIHFAWYAAEERGLVGSKYVVKHFETNAIPVHAAIQFDMVGWNSPEDSEDVYLVTDYTDENLNRSLKGVIQEYTKARVGETRCGYPCSDHANWHRAGVPVVFPFESSFSNMNHKLHTSDDKQVHLDKDHMGQFAQIAIAFLGEVAELVSLRAN